MSASRFKFDNAINRWLIHQNQISALNICDVFLGVSYLFNQRTYQSHDFRKQRSSLQTCLILVSSALL